MMPSVGVLQQVQLWQGQYPPPEAIERYEKLLPGVFKQMVTMAEQLQTAQIDGNKRALAYTQADTKRGHYLGALVSIAAMGCAEGALYLGYPWVAGAFLGVPVMAVATAFINSTKKVQLLNLGEISKQQKTPTSDNSAQ